MKESGFTIVEVVIAAFVFSIIGILVGNIFVQSSHLQRRGFSAQAIQENAQFALEMMTREIRVGAITTVDSECSSTSLDLIHPVNGSVWYSLSGGVVVRTEGGVRTELTSTDVNVTKMVFCISGSASNDDRPTRVTIVMNVQNRTGRDIVSVPIQTTVVSRDIASELIN